MKKILTILFAGLILTACTGNKQSINTKELQGTYEIDFNKMLSDFSDDDDDELATELAAMLLSQMKMTMQFDGDKLTIDASETARKLLDTFGDDDDKMPYVVEYTIKNDSVLYIKENGEDFKEEGIIRKVGDSYDNLQFVSIEDGEETVLYLNRQAE